MGEQRSDGSWIGSPFLTTGDLGVTATAWAALHVAGVSADHPAVTAARNYVEAGGGADELIRRIGRGDLGALYLAMAGLLDARRLPVYPLHYCLIAPLRQFLERRIHGGLLTFFLETAILTRRLRGDWGPDGGDKSDLDTSACRRCLALLDEFQQDDGSWWNGLTHWSALIIATLHAMALPESDDRITRGLPAIHRFKIHDESGLRWMLFGNNVWATSFHLRALLAAGESPDDPRIGRGVQWLIGSQIDKPQSLLNNRQTDVPRSGGWSFQKENELLPDLDDTAVTLSTLGLAARLAPATTWARPTITSAERGLPWVYGMQNPDGGWASYLWNMPEKPVGPGLSEYPELNAADPFAAVQLAFEPPAAEVGDPSFEDIVGRVLHGLGQNGATINDLPIRKAIEFLRTHQFPDGRWFGRWINYVVATSFVLSGVRAVGVDANEEWLQRAVHWLLSKQNSDGGWGETHESYRRPELAGIAPSMPGVTGIVIIGLAAMGLRDHPAVARGIRFLLDTQRPDGTWDHHGFLHTFNPPDTFYVLPDATHFWPLEALGVYHHGYPHTPAGSRATEGQADSFLDAMRHVGDARADTAFAELVAIHPNADVVSLLAQRSATVPVSLAAYLTNTAVLPDWADTSQMATAGAVFARFGWEVALGLFCAALPQGYAAGPCARAMGRTRQLIDHTRGRVFETAQFLFDVLEPGGLAPGGRGIAACQRVRLMHAAIRQRTAGLIGPDGKPVNQEDMLGTLLLFSLTTMQTLDKLGLPITPAERSAWIHTWAVVGHLLGIDARLLPQSPAHAEVQLLAFRRRHWQATPEGKELTGSLVGLMQSYYPAPFAQVPILLIRYLSGPRCADLLGLPTVDWSRLAVETLIWLSTKWAEGEVGNQVGQVAQRVIQQAMQGLMLLQLQGQTVNWSELLGSAVRLSGMVAPGPEQTLGTVAVVRNLAYWLMRSMVAVERGTGASSPLRSPAFLQRIDARIIYH